MELVWFNLGFSFILKKRLLQLAFIVTFQEKVDFIKQRKQTGRGIEKERVARAPRGSWECSSKWIREDYGLVGEGENNGREAGPFYT